MKNSTLAFCIILLAIIMLTVAFLSKDIFISKMSSALAIILLATSFNRLKKVDSNEKTETH